MYPISTFLTLNFLKVLKSGRGVTSNCMHAFGSTVDISVAQIYWVDMQLNIALTFTFI